MSILSTIDRQILASSSGNEHSGPLHDFWYSDVGGESDAGIRVTETGALAISTVWKCVNWYFKMFGTLPKKLFERTAQLGRSVHVEARGHPLFPLIHTAPSPLMTSAYWFGLIAADLKLWGNSYAVIERFPNSGRIRYLWRLTPDKVRPDMVTDSTGKKQLLYFVLGDSGLEVKFYPDEILHVRGLGFDGIKGYSPIRMQMNLLGANRAISRYGARFSKNASRPSGIVSTEAPIKPENRMALVESLTAAGKDAGKLILIEGAVKFHKLTMDQDEAQFIETLAFQEDDIAGMMEVKPHEIGILRHATNNNIEQETISSVTRHLSPLCVFVEQWFDLQLLSSAPSSGGTERERFFHQIELKGLMRGDTATQTAHLERMIDKGVYSQNMALDYLGLPPFDGGDRHYINAAYIPIDKLDDLLDKRGAVVRERRTDDATAQDAAIQAVQARMLASYVHVFANAAARLLKRSKRDTQSIFRPVLEGLAAAINVEIAETFWADYLAAMDNRSAEWSIDMLDSIAIEELKRAIAAILSGKPPVPQLLADPLAATGGPPQVHMHMHPPPVMVQTPAISVEAPQITIQPPAITIQPPAITIEPPVVKVEVTVPEPRKVMHTIQRDDQGRMSGILEE